MREIDTYRNKINPGRETRLFNEWEKIDAQYSEHNREISYIIRKRNPTGIPIMYDIVFRINTIVGVKTRDECGLQKPLFGNKHILRIKLPNNYPSVEGGYPDFKFSTDVWHPNVRYFGDFKGRVCLNYADAGAETNLVDFIEKVAEYLKYFDYHAINEYPFPEDSIVAQWVLEQAEPQNWLRFHW
jgi:ubiquitin-protein ligase